MTTYTMKFRYRVEVGGREFLVMTDNICPPIPTRRWDWQAVTDEYEPGHPIGVGETETAALFDLMEKLLENDDAQAVARYS